MKNLFRSVLKEKIIVLDGAMGTMLQQLNLGPKDFGGAEFEMLSDILSLTRPDALESVHLQYLQAGADCIETNTFGASPLRLKEYDFSRLDDSAFPETDAPFDIRSAGYDQIAHEMNLAGCRAARTAIDTYKASLAYDGRPLFVAGSVGPSNYVLSPTQADLKHGTWDEIARNFYVQVKALIQGGADIVLFETQQDILEVKAAIAGAKQAMTETGTDLPIMVQVTVNAFSRMQIFNTDILAALATVQDMGIDVFGINCSLGPDLMAPTVEKLAQASSLPISILPNAGLPESENGRTVYRLSPEDLAGHLHHFAAHHGVNLVGGCCGTTPDHIRQIKKRVSGITPSPDPNTRGWFSQAPRMLWNWTAARA